MTDFLQMPNKFSGKKKRQINKNKQKISKEETSSRKATIGSLNSSDKKKLPVSMPATKNSEPKAENIDIAMICTNTYCAACHWKEAQIFALSMRDIQYQAGKKARAETNPKNIILQEYHNFLDIFSKKDSETLSLY